MLNLFALIRKKICLNIVMFACIFFIPIIFFPKLIYAIESQFVVSLIVEGTAPTSTPTTTPEEIPAGRTGQQVWLRDLSVVSGADSARVIFNTYRELGAMLSWGETSDLELGTIAFNSHRTYFNFLILELKRDTVYYFSISLTDKNGASKSFGPYAFKTLLRPIPYEDQVANVINLRAYEIEGQVFLKWEIPQNEDISAVRILKSEKGFPKGIHDGELLAESYIDNIFDQDVIKGKEYYYTVFSKNSKGYYSSGAIISIAVGRKKTRELPITDFFAKGDYRYEQDGVRLKEKGSTIEGDSSRPINLFVNENAVPKGSEIYISISKKDNENYGNYFLSYSERDKSFTITLPPFISEDDYVSTIYIKSKPENKKIIKAIDTLKLVSPPGFVYQESHEPFYYKLLLGKWSIYIALLLLILLIILVLSKKKNKPVDREKNHKINETI